MNKLKGEMIKMNSRMENVSIVKEIPTYSLTDGLDACKWGVSDLYEEAEKNLRELLTYSGEFRTEWCDCKKELFSFRLWFTDNEIKVEVSQWMDDLYEQVDLIDDAIWALKSSGYKFGAELNEDDFENIRDMCFDAEIETEVMESKFIKRDSTYEEIMSTLNELADLTGKELDEYFEQVKSIVSYYSENCREKEIEE
jgi:hypothetical protein